MGCLFSAPEEPVRTAQDLMHGPTDFLELFGDTLVRSDGSTVPTLEGCTGKIIGVLFGASWCPPCVSFSPKIKDLYDAISKDKEPFEIVLVSSDNSEKEMLGYTKDWLSLPFGSPQRQFLEKKYQLSDIPTLIILRPDGSVMTLKGRSDVNNFGKAAFYEWKGQTDM